MGHIFGRKRGAYIAPAEKNKTVTLIVDANNNGARVNKACEIVEITPKTYRAWKNNPADHRKYTKNRPSHALTEQERAEVISTLNSNNFRDMPPSQIVPKLADAGKYIASEASFYRILKQEKLNAHRGNTKPKTRKKPEPLIAHNPNEIWSWDITYLHSTVKGIYFYLYLVIDIFSRKIVGFKVHAAENSETASHLMREICDNEDITNKITLHSDNGSPMKGATLLATLQNLGISPSFSRPSVSNDNPYSESMFKTLKYNPRYPSDPFGSVEDATLWVADFVKWYNEEHLHSGINFVTPMQRHLGKDQRILENRKAVYLAAKQRNPSRWSGNTRDWSRKSTVHLNPGKSTKKAA